jgi:hypothetical protein
MTRVRFFRLSHFVWVPVVAALYLSILVVGLPHMLWTYDFRAPTRYSTDFDSRFYTRCSYAGPYGVVNGSPKNGRCAWIRFMTAPGRG